MNKETPLTAIGDEAIEARIVAWVLGEASAFEAAELERLCAERPELAIFHRRMRAMHGWIREAETAGNDQDWKLPPAKRVALLDQIDAKASLPDLFKETRARRSAMRSILSIAACVLFVVIILGLSAPMFMNQRKKSDVIVAYQAAKQRELAAAKEQMEAESMMALRTEFPKELIEGTPKPMVLPERTPNAGPVDGRTRLIGPPASSAPAPSDAMAMADVSEERKVSTNMERKPSSPSSAMSKVIVPSALSDRQIPVPEVDVNTPSLDFGDGNDFGTGWGDASGGAGGGFSKDIAANGTRSSDGAVKRDNIDNVLSDPHYALADTIKGGIKQDLSNLADNGVASDSFWDTSQAEEPKVHGEIHTGYSSEYLFRGEDLGKTGEGALTNAPHDAKVANDLAPVDDGIRTNPAVTYEHTRDIDQVRRDLYKAEGNYNLGKYDEAKKEYEEVLRTDPYNTAARKGMERLAAAKSDYYRAAYDHTRAELLMDVDKAWELAVPAEQSKSKQVGGDLQYPTEYEAPESTEALAKAVRDQEAKVEESRKVLATIVRTKGIIYKGEQTSSMQDGNDSIQRSMDIQDYVDAKREFEKEQALLETMKSKLPPAPEPTPDPASFIEETSAAEEPYSTFSLNISDASFRIAQAALAKGERPDPAGIKVEQFYNAVDYGDPAPAAGEPVACAIEQAAHPVIPGRNLVRVSLKTAAAGRSAAQPLRLTLLVDQSGSMSRADRREAMAKALSSLGGLLTAQDKVNVIGFARTSRLLADGLSGDQAAARLADVANPAASEGGTNLETAIDLAAQLAKRHHTQGAQNRIVLFTDGAANLGDADPLRLAAKVEQLRQQGVAFDIAGIAADDLNDNLLGELARKGNGRYSVVGKGDNVDFAKQLAGAFRPAAENVKVQVRFNPERVARYKLIGFEKDRLKTEDFRNDKVDAAELAAEEAGVAVYQVETIPNGRGEIGEVSVRFRDTARGEMVERMWTMTHAQSAPAIDQAAPSMQLATLALLAGEKLKGGPLADAIDFKQLAVPQAAVKQAYGQDARVSDLLRMVDALK